MKRITFHFDPISPFAYLAFERLPQVLAGCSYEVEYRPVLFAGLLQHWGKGLKGCTAGVSIAMPCCCASQATWRKVQARLGSTSAGP